MTGKVINMRTTRGLPVGAVAVDRSSVFGNPFFIGRDGSRADVIAKYREWAPTQPKIMSRLHTLVGRDLACWCHPKPCHGDVLLEMVCELA